MDDAGTARPVRLSNRVRSRRHEARVGATRDAWIAAAFLFVAVLLGGSSRFVLLPYLALQLLSVAAIGYSVWRLTPDRRSQTRPYALAVMALGGLMVAQLIPLPPGLWNALPGHHFYADALAQVGLVDGWRPWSMTPDLTRESLLAVLPILAAAMLFAPLDAAGRRLLLDTVLICVAACALVFVLQTGSSGSSFYDGGNQGAGGGLFANRNHLALFLACGIVATVGRWRLADRRGTMPAALMLVAVMLALGFLIVTGSRAGLVAGAVAVLSAGAVFARHLATKRTGWRRMAIPAVVVVAIAAIFAVGSLSTRQASVDRLLQTRTTLGATELRVANLPAVIDTAWAFFPLGSGFGSFDPVFRRFESDALLRPSYFNHAHDDAVEVLIEGGLPAMLLMMVALFWLARRSGILLTTSSAAPLVEAQVGLLGLMILCAGSLVDYPLRTPFLGVVAVLFATWAGAEVRTNRSGAGLGTDDGLR